MIELIPIAAAALSYVGSAAAVTKSVLETREALLGLGRRSKGLLLEIAPSLSDSDKKALDESYAALAQATPLAARVLRGVMYRCVTLAIGAAVLSLIALLLLLKLSPPIEYLLTAGLLVAAIPPALLAVPLTRARSLVTELSQTARHNIGSILDTAQKMRVNLPQMATFTGLSPRMSVRQYSASETELLRLYCELQSLIRSMEAYFLSRRVAEALHALPQIAPNIVRELVLKEISAAVDLGVLKSMPSRENADRFSYWAKEQKDKLGEIFSACGLREVLDSTADGNLEVDFVVLQAGSSLGVIDEWLSTTFPALART